MAEFDLTPTISQYLDRHLIFPLLVFLDIQKVIYPEEELVKSKLELLEKTNMVDFGMDLYKKLHKTEDVPAEMKEKRETVVAKMKDLTAECNVLLKLFENEGFYSQFRSKAFTPLQLEEKYGVTPASIDALYRFAKFSFECGNYSGAAGYLSAFRILTNDPEKSFSALWGKLASEILMQKWDEASKDIAQLKEIIDSKNFSSPLKQLQQRTWLIHWSLFVYFNHPDGRNGIIDTFLNEKYLNAIQTVCPHILRYLTTAVITNKRRRNVLKDLVKVIVQEGYTYRDPITEFLEALYVNFDFEGAQQKLVECEKVLSSDFFLVACKDEFIENARLFIFETYCRIHHCIDIAMLASKLNMNQESAERWIVDLIRNAKLDAKIDSKANTVLMGTNYPSIYQKVIEKTKGISFRSNALALNLSKNENKNYKPSAEAAFV